MYDGFVLSGGGDKKIKMWKPRSVECLQSTVLGASVYCFSDKGPLSPGQFLYVLPDLSGGEGSEITPDPPVRQLRPAKCITRNGL